MAEKIKGFTIELSLEHLKVDSGLKNVRRSIAQMNSEMRANMSVFDRGERSMKKYTTQLNGLNKKLELQKQIVQQAKKDYEKMVEVHGAGSKEAHQAAVAYNREVAQLNNLERYVQRVTKEMQAFKRQQEIQSTLAWRAGDAFVKFGNDLDVFSDKAKRTGNTLTKYLTLPITGLITTVGGFGFKRAMDLEQVEFMMRHISDSAKEYEKRMETVVDLVTDTRFGTAEIGNEFAKLIGAGAGDESARIFNEVAMNLATFKSDDTLIQRIGDIYAKALQGGKIDGTMLNQFTDAGVDIAKVLGNKWGKSTDEVKEILRSGNFDIEEVLYELSEGVLEGTEGVNGSTKAMGGMLELSGRTLSGQIKNFFAAVSQTGERLIKETGLFDGVKDALDELRAMLKSGELDSILLPTFQGLAKALEALVDVMRKVFKWFSNLSDTTKRWIGYLVGALAVIGPIITALGVFGGIVAKVSKGLGVFLKWIAPLTKGFGFLGKATGGAGRSVGLLSRAFTILTGPVGIVITIVTALATAFVVAYKRSEKFRDFIDKLIEKLKEFVGFIIDWMRPGFDAVLSFFKNIKRKISTFVTETGPSFIEAWQNIWTFIEPILGAIWTAVKWVFEKVKWIIGDFVMPFIEFVIKSVWGNIEGIIVGTLDVIMGAVEIFSGLFTGDFDLMWQGVKKLFFGAIKVIWNWIQLAFIGRILKGAGRLAKGFWNKIKEMWSWVKETFSKSISVVWEKVKNSFIGRIIRNIIEFAKNFRKNMSEMWVKTKEIFSRWISNIRGSIEKSFVGRMLKSVRELKSNFIKLAKEMWQGVKRQFNNIVDGAKALPGRIGKGIRGAKSKATNAMKSVGNGIIKWAGKPFNKVVDGVNWITGKLGIKTKVPRWDYPQYAKGTRGKGHPGGIAMIGEEGRELVKLPDGRTFVSPDSHTLLNLPKGTHVIPNRITEKLLNADVPHYAKGTKGWLSSLKDSIKDVWDYISNPSKLVDKVIDKISVKKNLAQIPQKMVNAGWGYVKTKPYYYIKSMFAKAEKEGLGGVGKPAFGWPITSHFGYRIHPITGQRKLHGGVDYGAPMGAPVPSTMAGRVSYAGYGWNGGFGNLVRVKRGIWETFYAHLSSIAVRAGQAVRKGQIIGRVGSTGASTGPHLHYELRKRGVRVNPLKGLATGGLVKSKMLAMLGEEGEEVVIPLAPNRRTDAMKLLALTAKKLGVDSGSFARPNEISHTSFNDGLKEVINLLIEQNEQLRKSNELLTALLGKDLDLYKLNKKVDEGLSNLADRRNAALGIK